MQDDEKILAHCVSEILTELRAKTGKSLNLFCNEYGLPSSTLNDIENEKISVKLFTLLKFLKAYNVSLGDFSQKLEKKLPKDFLKPDE